MMAGLILNNTVLIYSYNDLSISPPTHTAGRERGGGMRDKGSKKGRILYTIPMNYKLNLTEDCLRCEIG